MSAAAPAARPGLGVAAALGCAAFVTSFGAHVVAVNLPAYVERVGAGVLLVGVLIAAYDAAELVAKPLAGSIADRRGLLLTLRAGIVVFIGASLLYLALPAPLLILVRFLQGVGAAALSATSAALVAAYFTHDRGRAFGVYNAVKGAGYVLSPAIGGSLAAGSGFAAVFVASAAVGVVALAIALRLPAPPRSAELDGDDLGWRGLAAALADRALAPWYAITVANMVLLGALFGFLPVRLHDLGLSAAASGALLSLAAAAYLLVQPAAGALADRIAPALTVRAGLVAASLALAGLAAAEGPLLAALAAIAGAGVGVVWTNGDTEISRRAAPGRLATTLGAAGSFKELGDLAGPLAVGAIAQAAGLGAGFGACAAVGLAAALVAHPGRAVR